MTACQGQNPGYRIDENVLSAEECEALVSILANDRVGKSRAGARQLMSVPDVARVARDPRLLDLARCELGSAPFPFRATLFEKSGQANWLVVWHQDRALPLQARFDVPGWDRGRKKPVLPARSHLRGPPASWL